MAQFNYIPDANDQFTGAGEALPAGLYKVQIVDTDLVDSKSGDAEMIKVVYEVVADPQFEGRKIFDNIIIKHRASVDAVRIGKQKLNTICVLTGTKSLKDTAQLHGKNLSLLVTTREYNGALQNSIKKYLSFHEGDEGGEDDEEQAPSPAPAKKKPSFVKG
jgi:hypothetical protein